MKKILVLILIITTLSNCSDNNDPTADQIIGEWKLMQAKFYGLQGESSSEGSIDYSKDHIIYNFYANGTLIVSGGNNAGHPVGEYRYFFGKDRLGDNSDPQILLVKINGSKWTYNLTNGKMTLGKSYVDGPNLVFEKK